MYMITVKSITSDGFQNRRLCSTCTTFDSTCRCSHQLMTSCAANVTGNFLLVFDEVLGQRFPLRPLQCVQQLLDLRRHVAFGSTCNSGYVRTRTTFWSSLPHVDLIRTGFSRDASVNAGTFKAMRRQARLILAHSAIPNVHVPSR